MDRIKKHHKGLHPYALGSQGAVAAMPLGKCPVLCSSYETERKKALRAMETQWIFYPECNMYSNSKNHNISSRQKRHGWLKAAEALCCSFIVIVFVPIADVLRPIKNQQYTVYPPCVHTNTHTLRKACMTFQMSAWIKKQLIGYEIFKNATLKWIHLSGLKTTGSFELN